jgi:hypothetical protein
VPTFCRHNRFIERCPICSKTLPGAQQSSGGSRTGATRRAATPSRTRSAAPRQATGVRVRREARSSDDGYRSPLVPGLRASADAARLADEIGFASGRLLALAAAPTGLYAEAAETARHDLERATWMVFLTAYLAPLQGPDPFAGISAALEAGAPFGDAADGEIPSLEGIPLGPRSSHDPARGGETLAAYVQWASRGQGGTQAQAYAGDAAWTPERRFERVFERLVLPGLGRTGRFEALVTLGRLGLYDLRPDSLHLGPAPGTGEDATTLAAKRIFGIADPLLLERRAATLAEEAGIPVEALDLALANWSAEERATVGFSVEVADPEAAARAAAALEL